MDIDVPDLSYLSDVYKTRNAADVPNAPPNIAAKKERHNLYRTCMPTLSIGQLK